MQAGMAEEQPMQAGKTEEQSVQGAGRSTRIVLLVVVAFILLTGAGVAFFHHQEASPSQMSLSPESPATKKSSNAGTVSSSSQDQVSNQNVLHDFVNSTVPKRLQFLKEELVKRKIVVIVVAVFVLLAIGATVFGVVYKQKLDDEELAMLEERRRLEEEAFQAEQDRINKEIQAKIDVEKANQQMLLNEKNKSIESLDIISSVIIGVAATAIAALIVAIIVIVIKYKTNASQTY